SSGCNKAADQTGRRQTERSAQHSILRCGKWLVSGNRFSRLSGEWKHFHQHIAAIARLCQVLSALFPAHW
ncbi:hypothetical protein, partial [Klebsiella pneumoniae]|uniref:hypothetical protein n=1 Tax=Klebsiella pneumoniae TaxID=573 RepID=UPI00371E3ADC